MPSDFTKRLLILSKLKGVGRAKLKQFASDGLFFKVPLEELGEVYPDLRGSGPPGKSLDSARASAAQDLEKCEKNGDKILSILDPGYPELLRRCDDAPALLFVRSTQFGFSNRSIAIIGTREPTASGSIIASRISDYFSSKNWTVVGGLALGVDTIAHKSCLAAGGNTVAVLAHGLDHLAPKSNQYLAREIVEKGGALVSEYSYQTAPFSSNFVERDRIQAGLAKGVIVIQTDVTGGSLHACRASLRYGRFVFAPTPTKRDLTHNEPKIQGILRILHGTAAERMRLLRCEAEQLGKVLELSDRDDFPAVEEMLEIHSR